MNSTTIIFARSQIDFQTESDCESLVNYGVVQLQGGAVLKFINSLANSIGSIDL